MPVHRPVTPVAGDIQYIELEQNQERAEPSPKPSRSSLSSTVISQACFITCINRFRYSVCCLFIIQEFSHHCVISSVSNFFICIRCAAFRISLPTVTSWSTRISTFSKLKLSPKLVGNEILTSERKVKTRSHDGPLSLSFRTALLFRSYRRSFIIARRCS